MIGIVAPLSNRTGEYSIAKKTVESVEMYIPAGSKILCPSCELQDETNLITNGIVVKSETGYEVVSNLDAVILKNESVPLTVMHGREMMYVEGSIYEDTITFYLPKGARINQQLVETTGNFTMIASTKYLIEY